MIHSAHASPDSEPVDGDPLASTLGWYQWANYVMARADAHPEAAHLAGFGWSDRPDDLERDLEQLLHAADSDPDTSAVTAQVLAALRARPDGATAFYATDGEPGDDEEGGTRESVDIFRVNESGPPGPPPRPNLVWNDQTHRWRNPETGEEHHHPVPGYDHWRGRVTPPDQVTARPKTKKARDALAGGLQNAWVEVRNALAAKYGTREINDHLSPEEKKAEFELFGQLETIATGNERDGPHDLGPVSDQRYAGYYRGAVQALDRLRALAARPKGGDDSGAKPQTGAEWRASLTPDERREVERFQGGGFVMQRELRSGAPDPDAVARAKVLDAAIAKSPGLRADATLYRGLDFDTAAQAQAYLADKQVGAEFADDGYASTSTDPAYIKDFWRGHEGERAVRVDVVAPAGAPGAYMSEGGAGHLAHEKEFLFARGGRFKVVARRPMGAGGTHLVVEYLGHAPKPLAESRVREEHGEPPFPGAVFDPTSHRWKLPAHDAKDETGNHPAETKAKSLLARLGEVPGKLVERVGSWVKAKHDKLAARYGRTGAKAILAAMILLAPTPIPGSSLIPIALAEGIRRLKLAVAGPGKSAESVEPKLSPEEVEKLARQLLRELAEEMGD